MTPAEFCWIHLYIAKGVELNISLQFCGKNEDVEFCEWVLPTLYYLSVSVSNLGKLDTIWDFSWELVKPIFLVLIQNVSCYQSLENIYKAVNYST